MANTSITPTKGTGTYAGNLASRVLSTLRTPLIGAVALTGVAVSLVSGTVMTPGAGALAARGQPVIFGPAAYTQQGTLFFGTWTDTALTPSAGAVNATGLQGVVGVGLIPTVGGLTASGVAPTMDRGVISSVGSLSVSGVSASRVVGTVQTPVAGLSLLSGTTPAFASGMVPSVGTLTLTGNALAPPNTVLTPLGAGLTLTASSATASKATLLSPSPGETFIGLITVYTNTPGQGSITLAGNLANVAETRNNTAFTPSAGSLFFGDFSAVQPTVRALTLTGFAPTVQQNNVSVQPGKGSLTLAGSAPNLSGQRASLTPSAGSLFFGIDGSIVPLTGTLALTGQVGNHAPTTTLSPSAGRLSLTLNPNTELTTGTGVLTLTPQFANPPNNTDRTPTVGALRFARGSFDTLTGTLALTGFAPSLATGSPRATPSAGALLMVGVQPVLQVSGGTVNTQPGTGAVGLSATNAILSAGIVPSPTSLLLTAFLGINGRGLVVNPGSLTMTGSLATTDQNNYDLRPLAGAMLLVGQDQSRQPLIIPTSVTQEGCGSINAVAQEGTTETAGMAPEGCSAVTSPAPTGLV